MGGIERSVTCQAGAQEGTCGGCAWRWGQPSHGRRLRPVPGPAVAATAAASPSGPFPEQATCWSGTRRQAAEKSKAIGAPHSQLVQFAMERAPAGHRAGYCRCEHAARVLRRCVWLSGDGSIGDHMWPLVPAPGAASSREYQPEPVYPAVTHSLRGSAGARARRHGRPPAFQHPKGMLSTASRPVAGRRLSRGPSLSVSS